MRVFFFISIFAPDFHRRVSGHSYLTSACHNLFNVFSSHGVEVRAGVLQAEGRSYSVAVLQCKRSYSPSDGLFGKRRTIMAKINLEVIDQFFSAQLSANESEATLKALRPQVEIAVQELIRQQGKPANFTGTLEYHGFKIVVRRPTSYTWEKNTQIQDPSLDYYKQLHGYYEKLQEDVKEARADLKRTAEKLAKAHPDSESIKHGFTIAIMA